MFSIFLHLSEYCLYLQSRKLSAPAFIECGMEQELRETIIQGLMAERLGKGLQNLVQRFDSASDLTETALQISVTLFSF